MTKDEALLIYKEATYTITENAMIKGASIDFEQLETMRYLKDNMKGLVYNEL